MTGPELWKFISAASTTPLGIPLILLLLREWNCSKTKRWVLGSLVYGVQLLFFAGVYLILGGSTAARVLAGTLPAAVCWVLFYHYNSYRGGKLLFIMTSTALLIGVTNTLSSFFAPKTSPWWLVWKLVLTALIAVYLRVWGRRPLWEILRGVDVGWGRMSLYPLCLLACDLCLTVYPYSLEQKPAHRLPAALLCLAACMTYLLLYQFFHLINQEYRVKEDNAVLRAQMRVLERQQVETLETIQSNRVFRHDLRHFLSILTGCIDTGEFAKAREVVDTMEAKLDRDWVRTVRPFTGSPILDTTLSHYEDKARAEGIQFTVSLSLPGALSVDETELGVVLSNSLENALNACRKMPKGILRAIRVTDGGNGDQYLLRISNTYGGVVRFDPETGLPLSERAGHGFGTQSMAAFAKKYGAVLDYSAEKGWFHLNLLI